ncbi:MAG: HAD family hydrolase [Candidatus Thermoplasmatota archaeon]|nr:HAD family hydrolase [Candidatus Thermoplasmatota archaeon]
MDIKGVVFDLDGTITRTGVRFAPFRERIGCGEKDVLEYISKFDEKRKEKAYKILDEYEKSIQEDCILNDGFLEVMDFLMENNIKTGIATRSSKKHAQIVMGKLNIPIKNIVGRKDAAPKPSGEPLILLSKMFDVPLNKMLFVGDFLWDMLAGRNAGVKTVLLSKDHTKDFAHLADYTIHDFRELIEIIER